MTKKCNAKCVYDEYKFHEVQSEYLTEDKRKEQTECHVKIDQQSREK